MQKPSLGRVVHVIVDPKLNNGSDVAPATITRVWSDEMINVSVTLDAAALLWRTSVGLYESREALEEALKEVGVAGDLHGAFWPSRD